MPQKKLLFITHQLSRTGAPIVLLDMIRLCLREGYTADVISLLEGELESELAALGITVSYKDDFWADREAFKVYASRYDAVIANTLISYQVIHALGGTATPVLWWLHEGEQYFAYFEKVLPDFAHLPANIHVYSVSHYVAAVIQSRYGCGTNILHFAVGGADAPCASDASDPWETIFPASDDTAPAVRFLTCGTYSKVKAQDVLAAAIALLSPAERAQCRFLFCGNEQMMDPDVFNPVCQIADQFPEQVKKLPSVPRSEVLQLMRFADFSVIPSRIDPMPTVAAETMMMKKPNIITNVCGVAHYISDGLSGLLCDPDDAAALADKIRDAIRIRASQNAYRQMASLSGKIYGNYFSSEVVEPKMLEILHTLTGER